MAMTTRSRLYLPRGYRVQEHGDQFRVVDPAGQVLWMEPRGPAAHLVIETQAWYDALRRETQVTRQERGGQVTAGVSAPALRGGGGDARRARDGQVTAGVSTPAEAGRRPSRLLLLGRLVVTAAAVVALFLLPHAGRRHDVRVPSTVDHAPAADHASTATSAGRMGRGAAAIRRAAMPARARAAAPAMRARAIHSAPQRRRVQYAVVFGQFSMARAANALARSLRAKGYVAHVVPRDGRFQVISPPYRNRQLAQGELAAMDALGTGAWTEAIPVQ
jgi:cell division septation protein DedD